MASTERYCDGCVFFRPHATHEDQAKIRFGYCSHPSAQEKPSAERFLSASLDLPPAYKYASIFREFGECGPDGALFQAAPAPTEQVAA